MNPAKARASFQATREDARRVQQDYDVAERYEAVLRADIMPQVLDRMWEAQGTGMTFGQAIASGDSPAAYLAGSFAARIDNLTRTAAGRVPCEPLLQRATLARARAGSVAGGAPRTPATGCTVRPGARPR